MFSAAPRKGHGFFQKTLDKHIKTCYNTVRWLAMRHRQAVRQRTLTPSFPRFESLCRSQKPSRTEFGKALFFTFTLIRGRQREFVRLYGNGGRMKYPRPVTGRAHNADKPPAKPPQFRQKALLRGLDKRGKKEYNKRDLINRRKGQGRHRDEDDSDSCSILLLPSRRSFCPLLVIGGASL